MTRPLLKTILLVLVLISLACSFPAILQPGSTGTPYQTIPQTAAPNNALPTDTISPKPEPTDPLPTTTRPLKTQDYDLIHTIELTNDGPGEASRIVIWVAMAQTLEPFQQVNSYSISPQEYETQTDQNGNLYAVVEFLDIPVGQTQTVTLSYQITVSAIKMDLSDCAGEQLQDFLEAETYIESDSPEINELALQLTQNAENDCQASRSIYDYIGDEFSYSQYTAQDLGALSALNAMEGDCTEFSDLFIALNRAAGIPARFVEGVLCCTDMGYRAGEQKHDWSEVHLPGIGWVPVDTTMGRRPNQRELYFAAIIPDHIILTRGRNLNTLGGYHYYYYSYWWDAESTTVNSNETWSILRSK